MLHILRHGTASPQFAECLSALSGDDQLLLIEDAVYASNGFNEQVSELDQQQRLYVLSADLDARGLKNGIGQRLDFAGWVRLLESAPSNLTW